MAFGIVVMSVIGFLLMGIDKRKARKEQWRIPEKTLWVLAILGGAPGMWVGMNLFRHKTKHTSFKIGLPFLTLLWAGLYFYVS